MEQLNYYKPSKTVYILFNKGFKNCKKNDIIKLPAQDITHAFLHVFKDANVKKYDSILILEDDFIFNEKIKISDKQENINSFLNKYKNTNTVYYLGCIPYLQIPLFSKYHNRVLLSTGSHSIIYTKKSRELILDDLKNLDDWDIYINLYAPVKRYIYYEAMCYQLFPETENSKTWGQTNGYDIRSAKILNQLFKFLHLDTKVEPGYSILYIFSKIIPFFFIIFIVSIFYFLFIKYKIIDKTKKYISKIKI
jgi:hypothetical protein